MHFNGGLLKHQVHLCISMGGLALPTEAGRQVPGAAGGEGALGKGVWWGWKPGRLKPGWERLFLEA